MAARRSLPVVGLVLIISSLTVTGQRMDASKDDRITPERLGFPKGNARTSEPLVTRIYKTDAWDRILIKQPAGYPFTGNSDYTLKADEAARVHEGVDLSSRPEMGR